MQYTKYFKNCIIDLPEMVVHIDDLTKIKPMITQCLKFNAPRISVFSIQLQS